MVILIRVNKVIPGYDIGQTYTIEVDANGVPFERMWRRRLRDSVIDQCCEIVSSDTGSKKGAKSKKLTNVTEDFEPTLDMERGN